jgi:hypothetical protein
MKNQWEKLFGAKRRASDRKLLMEVEKEITAAELREIELDVERQERARAKVEPVDEAVERAIDREAIARAFGRPLN